MKRWWPIRWILTVALVLSLASTAFAHAALKGSTPAPDQVLERSPERVELLFTEEVDVSFSAIAVYDHSGARVDRGDAYRDPSDPSRVVAALPPLRDGLYTVAWRVISLDGHPISGTYGFTVGKGIEGASYYQPELPDPNGPPPLGVLAGYWLALAGLMALAGLGLTQVLAVRLDIAPDYARWVWISLGATALGSALFLVARTAQAAGLPVVGALNPALLGRMLTTQTGLSVLARLAVVAAGAALAPRFGRRWWLGAAVGVAGLLTVSLGGHAVALERPAISVTLDWLHLLAAAVWTGGLLQFGLLLRRLGPEELGLIVRRFTPLAMASVLVLVATGAYPIWLHVPSWKALHLTDYGGTLKVKLALILPLLLLGGVNGLVVGPRLRLAQAGQGLLRRISLGETALMGLVLGAAVLLTNLPPARVALPPEELNLGMHTQNWAVIFLMRPLQPGYRTLDVRLGTHEGAVVENLKTTLELVHARAEAKHVTQGKYLGEGRFRFENVLLSMPGEWEFRLIVQPPGKDPETIRLQVEVPEAP